MKTIATLTVIALLVIVGYSVLSAGRHTGNKVKAAYATVQDLNDEQDAILRGGK